MQSVLNHKPSYLLLGHLAFFIAGKEDEMKFILQKIMVLVFALLFVSVGNAEILYQHNFNDENLSDWTYINSSSGTKCGYWTIIEGNLQVSMTSCDAQNFRLDTLILPDSYIIEFDTRTIIDGASASLIGFYNHWSNWDNWVGNGYSPGRFYIREKARGGIRQGFFAYPFADADKFKWHHFKYIKDGDWSSLYYDGQVVYENIYFRISLTGGYFVLAGGQNGTHQFDNLVIRTLEISIEDILTSFDTWVGATLVGKGPGNSANGRLNALRNMLETAGDLIHIGDIEGACGQLKAALGKCDGDSPPPDFVSGDAVTELSEMILDLMESLGCE
ncbi:hypothetical protein ACFL36_03370 [Thermodesulfobacteriota bacterium]